MFALGCTVSACAAAAETAPSPVVHNKAMGFVEFWDAAKTLPKSEQLVQFKARVAPDFAGFYGTERFEGTVTQEKRDEHIQRAIDEFASIREGYITKARNFEAELPKNIASFKVSFPDFVPNNEIYVVHSLGEMDGGMRNIDGKSYLIFGVDGMVKYHGEGSDTPFFHHELFHTYHTAMSECDEANWVSLWREGLAVFAAKVLNPDANEQQLLLDIPDHMATRTQAVLPAALEQLEQALDKKDNETYAGLFQRAGDKTGLPPRRGYYLGYLVAQEAGKSRSVQQLAKLECGAVHELVRNTVHTLRTAAR
jgi:hypothetical protein